MKQIREDYNHTINACYIGFITQAIVNNLVPLLFLTFQRQYGFTLDEIALLVSLNFGVQLLTDACAPRIVDKMGERGAIMAAHLFSGAGLLGLSFLPKIVWDPYVGIAAAIVCYAVGGGLIEVMVSPIVEACPTKRKEAAMSLLHSFYCWGHVAVILLSTAFFAVFGTKRWDVLACLWAVIPLLNTVYFRFVPIFPIVEEGRGMTILELAKKKIFWILFLVMIAAGAAEQGMSQWASAFAEAAGNSLKMGLLSAVVFPVLLMVGISLVKNEKKNN
ncbi:hypothetical protein B5F13_03450 [Drancourtella sp. An177]|nr:MFS transporter [uncultured Sellimonas sp.]OUP66506.1 hypothetical protein B5F13_03450 [Drancourtella sp. An177]